jgi:hypothetical protein
MQSAANGVVNMLDLLMRDDVAVVTTVYAQPVTGVNEILYGIVVLLWPATDTGPSA